MWHCNPRCHPSEPPHQGQNTSWSWYQKKHPQGPGWQQFVGFQSGWPPQTRRQRSCLWRNKLERCRSGRRPKNPYKSCWYQLPLNHWLCCSNSTSLIRLCYWYYHHFHWTLRRLQSFHCRQAHRCWSRRHAETCLIKAPRPSWLSLLYWRLKCKWPSRIAVGFNDIQHLQVKWCKQYGVHAPYSNETPRCKSPFQSQSIGSWTSQFDSHQNGPNAWLQWH